MYKFTSEEKQRMKREINELYEKYYLNNPILRVIKESETSKQQTQASHAKISYLPFP